MTRVACLRLAPTIGDLAANRSMIRRALSSVSADIVVLPELVTSGYVFSGVVEAEAAALEPSALEWWGAFGALVVGGFCERGADGRLYNSAAVVDASGVLAVYRKTHLWDRERLIFTPGDALPPVLDTAFGRLGVLVCYDLEFPEMPRSLALRGAELLCVPVNWPVVERPPAGEHPPEQLTAMSAARVNRVFIAVCDRTGAERGVASLASPRVLAEGLAAVALVAAIAAAIVRDRRAPEAVVALGGAALLLVVGVLGWGAARDEAADLAPTLVVLAALLVLGDGCERAGLFDALAARLARGARGSASRLLGLVVLAAATVTAVLGLDATVVLLTPAAFAAAAKARLGGRPAVYACAHLANSASLLLPISNLTNLLAFRASELSFARFAALMALPWAVAIAIEWGALRWAFRRELEAPGRAPEGAVADLPRAPLAVLAFTLAGFVAAGPLGLDAAWPAAAGALLMVAVIGASWRAIDLPLLGFVLGLGLIVRALADHGLGELVTDVLPAGPSLLALLGAALLAAVLANLLNNVPALLLLLPAAAAAGPEIVLAVLIGVNCGPNLTYTGSLATLLWRRVLRERGEEPDHGEFHRLGALTVPPILIGATVALWLVT